MKVSGKVNRVRRKIMYFLTNKLGQDKYKNRSICQEDIKNVLISRPNNRLGNQLLITPLVQEISELFPNCRIDLFVRGGVANVLFENFDNIDRIIKLPKKPFKELIPYIRTWFTLRNRRYDIVINVIQGSSSGRLSTILSRADYKFFNNPVKELQAAYPDYKHMAKNPVYNLRYALQQAGLTGLMDNPIPTLNIRLTQEELAQGKAVLQDIVRNDKKTFCIYTFATGDKCFSEAWWQEIYGKLKDKYSATYNILEVLPVENVSQIGFAAPSYYSKDLREIAAVIAHSELFLLADCGIMHLASVTPTPIVGLFSITDIPSYQPYGHHSIAIDTRTAGMDDILQEVDRILTIQSSN